MAVEYSSIAALVKTPQLTFDNVEGLEDQKKILLNYFIEPFVTRNNDNSDNSNLGLIVEPESGVLFYGKPGTGKTYLAEAFAGELQKALEQEVKFISIVEADIANKYIGETEKMVIKIFEFLKQNSPSVLFLDGLDTLAPTRSSGSGSSTHHYNGITTCFLKQLRENDPTKTIVIGATNRLQSVDAAIKISGRFDRHIGFFLLFEESDEEDGTDDDSDYETEDDYQLEEVDDQ